MRILLPPSETKRSGGGSVFSPASLAFAGALDPVRSEVRAALEALSADEEQAARVLKLGVKSRGEIAHNLALADSGAMPAIERYTGVLYDGLDVTTLDAAARAWLEEHVLVQSALFGMLAADDAIPAYRLSASSRLPGLDSPLAAQWRRAHDGIAWAEFGWVLDLRSKDYAQLAPLPSGAGVFLHIAQRGPDGRVRGLNHFNKAGKGALVRRLAEDAVDFRSTADLLAWTAAAGLETAAGPGEHELTLVLPAVAPGAPLLG